MVVEHWSRRACDVVNLLFSLICPVGALLFYFGTRELGAGQHIAVGCALGFSAGVFLCISLADILPEIQFHHHDRVNTLGRPADRRRPILRHRPVRIRNMRTNVNTAPRPVGK